MPSPGTLAASTATSTGSTLPLTGTLVEGHSAERGFVAEVEVDVPVQRTVWVKHRPASAARGIVLVMTFPRELDARPAIARHVTTVRLSLDRDEAHTAEAVYRFKSRDMA